MWQISTCHISTLPTETWSIKFNLYVKLWQILQISANKLAELPWELPFDGQISVAIELQLCQNLFDGNSLLILMAQFLFSLDVCYLRLDFESFTTVGPTDTEEKKGGECVDKLSFTVKSQHM